MTNEDLLETLRLLTAFNSHNKYTCEKCKSEDDKIKELFNQLYYTFKDCNEKILSVSEYGYKITLEKK